MRKVPPLISTAPAFMARGDEDNGGTALAAGRSAMQPPPSTRCRSGGQGLNDLGMQLLPLCLVPSGQATPGFGAGGGRGGVSSGTGMGFGVASALFTRFSTPTGTTSTRRMAPQPSGGEASAILEASQRLASPSRLSTWRFACDFAPTPICDTPAPAPTLASAPE